VHRNRIERALHEGARQSMRLIPEGFDFVVLTKRSILTKSTEEVLKEVELFFKNFKG
jgi:ribonuclease P protein component